MSSPSSMTILRKRDIYPTSISLIRDGYMSVEQLVTAHEQYQIQLMGSVPDDNSWQSRQAVYDSRHFTIDGDKACAFCPQGKLAHSVLW